jgi:hypothetical protein
MKTIIIIFRLLFLLASCGTPHKERNAVKNKPKINDDRIQRQFIEAMDNITAKLNMPNLKKGVDSFEMRIWCPMSAYEQSIIIIRYLYSQWHITETYVWESYPEREFSQYDTANQLTEVVIDSTKSQELTLTTDKEKFIDTLLNRYVSNFPRRTDLEGSFEIGMDSYRYIFEIAEKNNYQMLVYDCGGSILDKENNHATIREFLNFLQRQVNRKIPHCN